MKKPLVVLLDGEDGASAALAATLRAHGVLVAGEALAAGEGGPPVMLVVQAGSSVEATCSRIVRWCDAQPPARGPLPRGGAPVLVGLSAAIESVRRAIAHVAPSDANVLITGETGTGKELVAELIHSASGRPGPLVPINCAAIPDGLLESELFGYERGAFTGAGASYEGKLRLAQGGTILLDEIGDMSAYAQAKLLRAIETREVYRLGGRRPVPLDVRILAATNADLDARVAEGRFRQDLYFRINVARIHIPPLRERPEDVEPLLGHCLRERSRPGRGGAPAFDAEALSCLARYPWPGNVRELRNVVQVMAMGGPRRGFGLGDVPPTVRAAVAELGAPAAAPGERERLLAALRTTHWNKSRAAQELHWSRMTVYRKMAKYDIRTQS